MDTPLDVLIVDDMAPMREILSANLRTLGITNLRAVSNVRDAIQVLKDQSVTLVLTDWNMPVMTGLDLLQWIRQESLRNKYTPVVMITAEVNREQVEEAISSGVSGFILKPFTVNTLAERLQKALGEKGLKSLSSAAQPVDSSGIQRVNPFTLEVEPVPPASPVAQPLPLEGLQGITKRGKKQERLTILAVDDTPENLSLVSNLFREDYRVKIASNGEKAIKICESDDPPHLVLLDIMMPGMDGYEVIRHLKAKATTAEIPVIFITALSDSESIIKGLEAGAVDYITKPIEPSVVQVRVKNFLRYHRGYRELKDTLDTLMDNAKLREDVEQITRHDMKGPLSSIIGLLSQAVSEAKISLEKIKMIEEEAFSLLNMINLSTDLYKMETGRFSLEAKPVDIGRLINRVSGEIHSAFAAKGLFLDNTPEVEKGDPPVEVLGDELLCYSLLHNLIKNAAEASPARGTVSIKVLPDAMVKIRIHNLGVVPEPIRKTFFEKFVTMGKTGGTGLGTYSARLITEAQKGTIAMETSEEEGTTIEIRLPKMAVKEKGN